jgi:hypothetical protein
MSSTLAETTFRVTLPLRAMLFIQLAPAGLRMLASLWATERHNNKTPCCDNTPFLTFFPPEHGTHWETTLDMPHSCSRHDSTGGFAAANFAILRLNIAELQRLHPTAVVERAKQCI